MEVSLPTKITNIYLTKITRYTVLHVAEISSNSLSISYTFASTYLLVQCLATVESLTIMVDHFPQKCKLSSSSFRFGASTEAAVIS